MREHAASIVRVAVCLAAFALPGPAAATDYDIGPSGDYPSLAAMIAVIGQLGDGDVVVLHQDDNSLASSLPVAPGANVTIRSAPGGSYSIYSGSGSTIIVAAGGQTVTLETVTLRDSTLSAAVISGAINLRDAILSNNTIALGLANSGSTANIYVTENAGAVSRWRDNLGYAIVGSSGASSANFTIAAGKELRIHDAVRALFSGATTTLAIRKAGGGTLFFDRPIAIADPTINTTTNINISVTGGVLHLANTSGVYNQYLDGSDYKMGGSLVIGPGGTFRPTVTTGTLEQDWGKEVFFSVSTRIRVDTFRAEAGARLEVAGLSALPIMGVPDARGGTATWYTFMTHADGTFEFDAETFRIDSPLATVQIVDLGETDYDDLGETRKVKTYGIQVSKLENLSAYFPGVSQGADIYRRREDLTHEERLALDYIYWTGVLPGYLDDFFQALGGVNVMTSMSALRHGLSSLNDRVARRLVDFQRGELELYEAEPVVYSTTALGSVPSQRGVAEYAGDFGQLWAFAGQNWLMHRDENGKAGYNYAPYAFGAGYDWHGREWIAGGVASYGAGEAKMRRDKGTRTEAATAIASIYGSIAREGYYASLGLQGGYGWNRSHTSYPDVHSPGYNSWLYGGDIETGYMFNCGGGEYPFRFTPHAGLSLARVEHEGFEESGDPRFVRAFDAGRWNIFDIELGLRIARPVGWSLGVVVPSLDISYVLSAGDRSAIGRARFLNGVSGPAAEKWRIYGVESNRHAARLGFGLTAKMRNNIDVGLSYDLELRDKLFNNNLNLNVALGF